MASGLYLAGVRALEAEKRSGFSSSVNTIAWLHPVPTTSINCVPPEPPSPDTRALVITGYPFRLANGLLYNRC